MRKLNVRLFKEAAALSAKMVPVTRWYTFSYFYAWFRPGLYHLRYYGRNVYFRGRTSDLKCLYQIFRRNEYPIVDISDDGVILDIGANVGYFAILAKARYRHSQIICVEPDSDNFQLLLMNTRGLDGIKCIRAAVGGRDGAAVAQNPESAHWARRFTAVEDFENSTSAPIRMFSMKTVVKYARAEQVSLLKIDIEGYESELFKGDVEWLKDVRVLMIEIHKDCWKTVFVALNQLEYHSYLSGETLVIDFQMRERVA